MKDHSYAAGIRTLLSMDENCKSLASAVRGLISQRPSTTLSTGFFGTHNWTDGALMVTEVLAESDTSIDDACKAFERELKRKEQLYWHQYFQENGHNYLAFLVTTKSPRIVEEDLASIDEEKAQLLQSFSRPSKPTALYAIKPRRGLWATTAAILLTVFTITAYLFLRGPEMPAPYYDTSSSEGPRYSYLLTPDNITGWAERQYDPTKYFVRLDEQALVPIELLDEQEMRYQEYLSTRYPEKAEMRDSRAWLDPEFFHDPNNFMLPTDMEFHRGHCIRVFRRYWQAKETGKHVCPWDIDYRHLHHCFSMLEDVMLPPGPRTVQEGMTWSVSWRTKVCSWEP